MIDDLNDLPASVITDFINLIKLFNNMLTETLENLEEDSKRSDFEKIKAYLNDQLAWFANNIENWCKKELTAEQQGELADLQKMFEESKNLISKIESAPRH